MSLLRRLTTRTEGQDLIEYGVLIGFIAAATIASASAIGLKAPALYSATNAALPSGSGNPGNGNPGNGNPGNSDPVGNPGPGNPGNGNPGGGN